MIIDRKRLTSRRRCRTIRSRPAIERRKERIRNCTPSRIVEIANVEIERIIEDLEKEVIMYFRLNNLRNLSGICQEKISFRGQLSVPTTQPQGGCEG